ncbi:TraB/GumN family protein [Chitinophaga sancti]|uniref:TraB/GumN family protein n=1 Tax=Chitinophaga sancti TaxID=1004 RepID=A0A1K1MX10_9BACT|nr:TraB/GumN family protein [Chitinophaga sancti]WQD63059.1 TraB/GumN family protein [Chitinophaga sancti]WQG91316.1 TraB/GumN family protein [Chitinophaga sancti]SFW27593.1 hypothetical protein SAMN05661012_00964 [Chitinophaga sancti]
MKGLKYSQTIVICIVFLLAGLNAAIAQQRKGLLWEISGNGLKQPAYLFGTVHVYDTTLYALPQLPAGLVDKIDKVYFEMDYSKIDQAELMASILIKDSAQYLNKLLDTGAIASLKKLSASSPMLKMMGNQIYAVKPFILMSWISAGGTKAATVDFELFKMMVAQQKPVGGLETVKEQMAAVDAVPLSKQADMLAKALDGRFSLEQQVSRVTEVYTRQELDNLMTVLNDNIPVDASFDDAIRLNRNVTMADKIAAILRTEHPLIAVGAGHFGNNDGLIALLEKKGYSLKSVPVLIRKVRE